jgi:WD40 repeat protein
MPRLIGRGGPALKPGWRATVPDHVIGLAWSPDGASLAAAASTGPVAIFDAATGAARVVIKAHDRGTTAVAYQPGGGVLATAGQDGAARLWHPVTAEPIADLPGGGAAWVECLAWSPDGRLLAASAGRTVRVWDPAGNLVREFTDLPSTVADLAWRPGSGFLTAAVYGGVVMADPAAGDGRARFDWKGSPLKLAWSPDGKLLAHGNQDATVHFWYADRLADLQMSGYETKVRELSWDPSGRYLATGGGPAVCVWDCGGKGPAGSTPRMLERHDGRVTAVAYPRRGHLLASAGADGRVCLWQPGNQKAPRAGEDRLPGGEATGLAWSPDDRWLAAGGADGTVAVFRAG